MNGKDLSKPWEQAVTVYLKTPIVKSIRWSQLEDVTLANYA